MTKNKKRKLTKNKKENTLFFVFSILKIEILV
uniref:Uncharacterized protein n=1 Tax=viral metagenome TaxID=1070528 RepID=A0A6C0KVE7_9ZZZZ